MSSDAFYSESALFENAFHHAAIGMALVGLNGEFLKVNHSLCELVGYPEEELKALTFQDITFPDDLGTDLAYVAQLVAGEIQSYRMEKRYITKAGTIVWILLSVSLVRAADGQPRFFISQIKDITARKEVEREKEELLAKLQRSNSEIMNLRSKLLTICAWTKRVRCNDRWMTVDEFLVNELGLNLTHGMSAEAEEEFMKGRLDGE
jgi:PAS domain S-box-containing protein